MTWKNIEVSGMSEKDKQYMVMYGCTQDDMVAMMNEPMNFIGGHYMLAMSILSDAQECIARGNDNTARQYINKAKYVMREWRDMDLQEE
jgi:hypothetical protein